MTIPPNYKRQLLFFFSLLLIVFLFSCSTDKVEPAGPLVDMGVEDAEFVERMATSLVGQLPDGPGNPFDICANGEMLLMEDDPFCGYVDVGEYATNLINEYRAKHNLPPYVRAVEHELCAAREARKAVEQSSPHASDGCGWRSQGSTGGGRGGLNADGSKNGTVQRSIDWAPYLFYQEGPEGGHYQAMMEDRSRGVAVGYYATDRDTHKIIINYYNNL